MPVYVDDARIPFRGMLMCHMVSSDAAALHSMAAQIGVARRHFHRGHYNICLSKRRRALAMGAQVISARHAAHVRRSLEAATLDAAITAKISARQGEAGKPSKKAAGPEISQRIAALG